MLDRIFPFHRNGLIITLFVTNVVAIHAGMYLATGHTSFIELLRTDPSADNIALVVAMFVFVELGGFLIWKLDGALYRRAKKKYHTDLQERFD